MTGLAIQPALVGGTNEQTLITQVLDGDREAARTLYEAHVHRVHRLVFRLCGDEDLTHDLTQDVFIRAFDQLSRFRGEAAFSTWIHRIAVSVTLNALRKVRRLRTRELSLEGALHVPDETTAPSDPELRERLTRAIEALPTGARASVILHDIEGYTHVEIAAMLGIAVGTSKARLFDARVKLRQALADYARE
ncbi:MAG TPA: RNA polymerase sigma factor [Gemmatimonadaceae bacterium]|jgi:RNA polymerase sigma-70 factor (ECF subfamily)|nr:RNA polymerase sigma factor [Gemmatimonadaceae bacterium]